MKAKQALTVTLVMLMALIMTDNVWAQSPKMKMTTDIPASVTAPDEVKTSIGTLNYFDGVPTGKTVDTVYDYLDRSRAVEAFMNCVPAYPLHPGK